MCLYFNSAIIVVTLLRGNYKEEIMAKLKNKPHGRFTKKRPQKGLIKNEYGQILGDVRVLPASASSALGRRMKMRTTGRVVASPRAGVTLDGLKGIEVRIKKDVVLSPCQVEIIRNKAGKTNTIIVKMSNEQTTEQDKGFPSTPPIRRKGMMRTSMIVRNSTRRGKGVHGGHGGNGGDGILGGRGGNGGNGGRGGKGGKKKK